MNAVAETPVVRTPRTDGRLETNEGRVLTKGSSPREPRGFELAGTLASQLDPAVMLAALDRGQDGVLILDANGAVVYLNRTFRGMVGIPDCTNVASLVRAVLKIVADPAGFEAMIRFMAVSTVEARFDLNLQNGTSLEVRVAPFTDRQGGTGRIWNVRDVTDQRMAWASVRERELEMIERLLAALDTRDEETGAHTRRIGEYAAIVAGELGWSDERVALLREAAPMHDIGKIGVADHVLQKPGRLTEDEFELLKTHTVIGGRLLAGSTVPTLVLAREIALSHHEHWDGGGYPFGLAGAEIPESARIVAVCDVYDALVHDRCYRPALSEDEALDIMNGMRGRQFDPRIYDAFLRVLPGIRSARDAWRDGQVEKAA